MRVLDIEQGSEDWLNLREGKLTGTKLGSVFAKSRTEGEMFNTDRRANGFYKLLAERLAVSDSEDGLTSSRERGKALEAIAVAQAEDELGLKLIHGKVWQKNDWHITSPDAWTEDEKIAVEIKCLASWKHIEAIVEDEPPAEYQTEYLNYFLVNPKLEKLYVYLYDPRFIKKKLQSHYWLITRTDYQYELARLQDIADEVERQIEELVQKLG